jgi:AcrR family transcriptional regulator
MYYGGIIFMASAGELTKSKIAEAALKLFKEYGYDNVTILDICKECKIAKSTFYYHIKSKESIIAEYYGDLDNWINSIVISNITNDNFWYILWKCFESIIKRSMEFGPDLSGQLFKINLTEDMGTFDFGDNTLNLLCKIIEKAQELGQIRNQNSAVELYLTSSYLIQGYDIMWCIKKSNFNKLIEAKKSLEILFDVPVEYRV